jgi:MFS family permease
MLKFCESLSYFMTSQILVIFLHYEFDLDDEHAGFVVISVPQLYSPMLSGHLPAHLCLYPAMHSHHHLLMPDLSPCRLQYGTWGLAISTMGLLLAPFNDALGVRKSMMLGFTVSALSYTCLAATFTLDGVFFLLFVSLPIGSCLGIPMLTIAIKRLTTSANRGMAFGYFYTAMNVAAFASGPIVDAFNLGREPDVLVPGTALTGNRWVLCMCALGSMCSLGVTVFCLRDDDFSFLAFGPDEVRSDDVSPPIQNSVSLRDDKEGLGGLPGNCIGDVGCNGGSEDVELLSNKLNGPEMTSQHCESELVMGMNEDDLEMSPSSLSLSTAFTDMTSVEHDHDNHDIEDLAIAAEDAPEESQAESALSWASTKRMVQSPTFLRFVVFSLFLINLRAVFRHLDATLPTYLVRQHGSNVPKGVIYSINPLVIIILTPLVSAGLSQYPHYKMIQVGGFITGISPFVLALSSTIPAAIVMIVVLSVGESIWSPRTYDYAMSIAPAGREATFAALASAPLFAAKIPVGLLSGFLLNRYMSEDDESSRNPQLMWAIIGALTISSPIGITLLEPYIREPMPEDDTQAPTPVHKGLGMSLRSKEISDQGKGLLYHQVHKQEQKSAL